MATHDIIDNQTEKLVDHLNNILGTTERARFAVGYLFLSGLTSVAKQRPIGRWPTVRPPSCANAILAC